MRAPLPFPGLPVGQGEVWRNARSRSLMLGLAVGGLVPVAGFVAVAAGLLAPGRFAGAVALPAIAWVSALLAICAFQERHLLQRAAVGLVAGWLGVLGYDVLIALLQAIGPGSGPGLVWPGLYVPPGTALASMDAALSLHWLALGGLAGLAYAVVAGRAHWGWGLGYGVGLWAFAVAAALTLPEGAALIPGLDLGRATLLLAGHAIFGAVLGGLNAAVQPDPPVNAKIVFLRDYVSDRVRVR